MIRINMRSRADTIKGQGVLSAYEEQVSLVSGELAGRFQVSENQSGRYDICLLYTSYSVTRPSVAASIVCDTTKPKERECEDASLIIYYAERDEDIWDIAKRYNTSLAAVMSENSLEGGRLCEKRMLLIPVV